jgi:serine O-acetyltransferase
MLNGNVNMEPLVSCEVPDHTREELQRFWEPSKQLIKSIRCYQRVSKRSSILGKLLSKWHVLTYRFWSVVTGADIPLNCQIGAGLMIPHPNGVVVHSNANIGVNCLLLQQVTLAGGRDGAPVLKGHVDVGAGAKILGSVTIGEHSVIGANAVVLSDVEPGAVMVGAPAKKVRQIEL